MEKAELTELSNTNQTTNIIYKIALASSLACAIFSSNFLSFF